MCALVPMQESRTHIVGEYEIYTEEQGVLEGEMRKMDACDMEKFGTLDSSAKAIAILGDRWWQQTAKQEGDKISKRFSTKYLVCNLWKNGNDHPSVRR